MEGDGETVFVRACKISGGGCFTGSAFYRLALACGEARPS